MSAETIPSEVATDLDCIRWYVECLDAVAFKRRAVAGLAEAEGSYNAAMKRLTDRSTRPAEPAAPAAEAGDGDVAASLAHLNIGYLYGIADALEHTDFTRAGDIRQCLLQVVKGLSASAASLEAERARADELCQERDQALIQIEANIAAIDRAKEFVRVAEQRAAGDVAGAEKAERERDAYHDALTPNGDTKALMIGEFFEEIEVRNPDYDGESLDEDEDDEPEFITHRVPVSWTTTKAMMERLRSYAHRLAASREAQAATDGGDNG